MLSFSHFSIHFLYLRHRVKSGIYIVYNKDNIRKRGHAMQKMLSYVRRAVDHYNMIKEGDRVAVAARWTITI